MSKWKTLTVNDFEVGDKVVVSADQGYRLGEVTKIARTRIGVRHPRNKQGDMVERSYGMNAVIMFQITRPEKRYPVSPTNPILVVKADGDTFAVSRRLEHVPIREQLTDEQAHLLRTFVDGPAIWDAADLFQIVCELSNLGMVRFIVDGPKAEITDGGRQALADRDQES